MTDTHLQFTEDNLAVVSFDVSDIDTYMKILDSPQTAEAMAHDGIKKKTCSSSFWTKQFTLDKAVHALNHGGASSDR